MTLKKALEINHAIQECNNRKESCKWHCDICEYGQYTMEEVEEANRIMNSIKPANDTVNHPSHYVGCCSGECIEYIRLILGDEGTYKFCIGSIIGYLWRYTFKNGMEDLEKASWYLSYAKEMNESYQDYLDENDQLHNLSIMIDRYKKKLEGGSND